MTVDWIDALIVLRGPKGSLVVCPEYIDNRRADMREVLA